MKHWFYSLLYHQIIMSFSCLLSWRLVSALYFLFFVWINIIKKNNMHVGWRRSLVIGQDAPYKWFTVVFYDDDMAPFLQHLSICLVFIPCHIILNTCTRASDSPTELQTTDLRTTQIWMTQLRKTQLRMTQLWKNQLQLRRGLNFEEDSTSNDPTSKRTQLRMRLNFKFWTSNFDKL